MLYVAGAARAAQAAAPVPLRLAAAARAHHVGRQAPARALAPARAHQEDQAPLREQRE